MVATLGDFDVGEMARRGQNARRQVVVKVRLDRARVGLNTFANGDDLVDFIGADHGVHFGQVLLDIAAITLYQATGDNEPLGAPDLLVLRHLQDRVDGFFLGWDR